MPDVMQGGMDHNHVNAAPRMSTEDIERRVEEQKGESEE